MFVRHCFPKMKEHQIVYICFSYKYTYVASKSSIIGGNWNEILESKMYFIFVLDCIGHF